MKKILIGTCFFLAASQISAQSLNFDATSNQYKVITNAAGYIGIGAANPSFAHFTTDRSRFYFSKPVTVNGAISAYDQNDLLLQTNGNTRMFVNSSNGNVGIGTTNPRQKLEVNGGLLMPSESRLSFGTENPNSGSLKIHNSDCCYHTAFDYSGNLYFREYSDGNGGATLGLQSDGTVTIGVWEKYDNTIADTDGHKLMVNGGILCENIKVILDVPNSDHVFADDYELMSLDSVEKFYETHKHLPEVPSAEEFCTDGYNVGTMDDLLLRKVEELTLYVVELQKKIEALEGK